MTRLSVIVPTFNCARYIGEALASIQAQTVQPDEVIVVDDGSTDDTAKVVAGMGDTRIRYLRKANGGAASARNVGLDEASGEYIAFLDADDYWEPRMLETTVGMLDAAPEVAFCFTNFERFTEPSGASLGDQFRFYHGLLDLPRRPGTVQGTFIISADAFQSLIPLGDFPAFTQVMLFRRSRIGNLRFDPSLRRCEDLPFMLRAALTGSVAYTTAVLAQVRRHDANLTANSDRLAIDKFGALAALSGHLVLAEHLGPYRDRMVRAHLDACRVHLRHGEMSEGVRHLGAMMTIPGSWGRKAKGLARVVGMLPAAVVRQRLETRG